MIYECEFMPTDDEIAACVPTDDEIAAARVDLNLKLGIFEAPEPARAGIPDTGHHAHAFSHARVGDR